MRATDGDLVMRRVGNAGGDAHPRRIPMTSGGSANRPVEVIPSDAVRLGTSPLCDACGVDWREPDDPRRQSGVGGHAGL